jgi:uncharacterized RmlC-like cupin family protein
MRRSRRPSRPATSAACKKFSILNAAAKEHICDIAPDKERSEYSAARRVKTLSATERVQVVKPGGTYAGKQGFTYGAGASAETVGASRICMNILPMPPGARAKVHYHEGIETIAFLLDGVCAVHYGNDLECRVIVEEGDQIYIPADVPHAPVNEADVPCAWLVVHSSGSDQDGIVLLPDLQEVLDRR